MSRIGKAPIEVPKGVEIKISNREILVKGPKGQLVRSIPEELNIKFENNLLTVLRDCDEKRVKSLHGLYRSLFSNMVKGVSSGFEKILELNGVGYRAALQGKKLILQLGYSHPVEFEAAGGVEFVVEGTNKITVKGVDKELVGRFAAKIRASREVEPYKGKGVQYSGEIVRRKAGKAAKTVSGGS